MNSIFEFHRCEVFAVKYSGEEYDSAGATLFDSDWVDYIID